MSKPSELVEKYEAAREKMEKKIRRLPTVINIVVVIVYVLMALTVAGVFDGLIDRLPKRKG